jgi:hypothetical protein
MTHLAEAAAAALVGSVVAGSGLPDEHVFGPTCWLFAAARDGLITGSYNADDGTWARSTDRPGPSIGTLSAETLLTVRIFGKTGETMLRATPAGTWRGRVLADAPTAAGADDPTAPIDRKLLLANGKSAPHGDRFTRITLRDGRTHVVPHAWAPRNRLVVRDYLARDPHTGQLRVACSRCVDVTPGNPKGNG